MLFKKREKRRINPWCVMIIGGLAIIGAVSLTKNGKEFITEKCRAVTDFFKKKKSCECDESCIEC